MFNDCTTLAMITNLLTISTMMPVMLTDNTIVDGRSGKYILTDYATLKQTDPLTLSEASVECVRRTEQFILKAVRNVR